MEISGTTRELTGLGKLLWQVRDGPAWLLTRKDPRGWNWGTGMAVTLPSSRAFRFRDLLTSLPTRVYELQRQWQPIVSHGDIAGSLTVWLSIARLSKWQTAVWRHSAGAFVTLWHQCQWVFCLLSCDICMVTVLFQLWRHDFMMVLWASCLLLLWHNSYSEWFVSLSFADVMVMVSPLSQIIWCQSVYECLQYECTCPKLWLKSWLNLKGLL